MVDWDGNFFISRKQFVCSFQGDMSASSLHELDSNLVEFRLLWAVRIGISGFLKFKADLEITFDWALIRIHFTS